MILTLGSSIRAASQSVETSGSSVADVMARSYSSFRGAPPELGFTRVRLIICPSRQQPTWMARTRNPDVAAQGKLPLRLLRLDLLDRPAGLAPGRKAAAQMRDRLQSHVLRGFRRQRRTHAAGAMKDELLVLLEDRLGVGAGRIDPEFEHAAGAGEGAGNSAVALDLAGIADID